MTTLPTVSFIVPVRDDARRLARCLASIEKNRGRVPIEVIVADNGSVDGSADVARHTGARVLELPDMRVAMLRNRAAAAARGEVLAFVDADHEIDATWVASAVDALCQSKVGAVGASYEAPPNGTWVQRAYGALRRASSRTTDTDWLASGNLAVWRHVFEDLQGFDTTLETCEDVDFCRRLRARSYRLVEDPRLRSVHYGDPRSLKALFLGELWRGRDNLRASLRGKIRLRELPSVAIPVTDLVLLIGAAVALVTFSPAGLLVSASALAPVFGVSVLRASIMNRRRKPATLVGFVQAIAVAMVYDVSRALALVARPGHQVRRRA
jgi:glycosyltransferase involved in cell wall biosynthesis